MGIIKNKIGLKEYYYLEESFRILNKTKKFRKYIGSKKPANTEFTLLESKFLTEIIAKLSNSNNTQIEYLSKKELIQVMLFTKSYLEKYNKLSSTLKNKVNIDNIILFTLTTLTTEDVDVSLEDVLNASKKEKNLSQRELICKNMLKGVDFIKNNNTPFDINYIKKLHKLIMAEFETKTPGLFRTKEVHIYKKHTKDILSAEIKYNPPAYGLIIDRLNKFIDWYNKTELNCFEKAIITHFEIYKIHPFLDGNKRICRLLFNKTLLDNNLPLINLSDNRGAYFDALQSSVENNDVKYLINFTLKEYLKQIKKFLEK